MINTETVNYSSHLISVVFNFQDYVEWLKTRIVQNQIYTKRVTKCSGVKKKNYKNNFLCEFSPKNDAGFTQIYNKESL